MNNKILLVIFSVLLVGVLGFVYAGTYDGGLDEGMLQEDEQVICEFGLVEVDGECMERDSGMLNYEPETPEEPEQITQIPRSGGGCQAKWKCTDWILNGIWQTRECKSTCGWNPVSEKPIEHNFLGIVMVYDNDQLVDVLFGEKLMN